MKKSFRVILFGVIAICLVTVGVFANKLLTPVNVAYYEDGLGACIEIQLEQANFQAKQVGNPQAEILAADNSSYPVFLNRVSGACQDAAELIP